MHKNPSAVSELSGDLCMFRVALGSEWAEERKKHFSNGKKAQEELIFLNLIGHWSKAIWTSSFFLNVKGLRLESL